jgi:hypothetical protein
MQLLRDAPGDTALIRQAENRGHLAFQIQHAVVSPEIPWPL